ncbi:hypothetical protein C8R45DRAFT_1133216 [Mycena sanguinolenta]|nr:hypothetical protein C8R45DRAFT_1133216 [Mycena sanguinolenta]
MHFSRFKDVISSLFPLTGSKLSAIPRGRRARPNPGHRREPHRRRLNIWGIQVRMRLVLFFTSDSDGHPHACALRRCYTSSSGLARLHPVPVAILVRNRLDFTVPTSTTAEQRLKPHPSHAPLVAAASWVASLATVVPSARSAAALSSPFFVLIGDRYRAASNSERKTVARGLDLFQQARIEDEDELFFFVAAAANSQPRRSDPPPLPVIASHHAAYSSPARPSNVLQAAHLSIFDGGSDHPYPRVSATSSGSILHPVAPEACGTGGASNEAYPTQNEPPDVIWLRWSHPPPHASGATGWLPVAHRKVSIVK